jgi:hypothetical protein
LVIGRRQRTVSVPTGVGIGAGVGFLLWFTADFMLLEISNAATATSAMADGFRRAFGKIPRGSEKFSHSWFF